MRVSSPFLLIVAVDVFDMCDESSRPSDMEVCSHGGTIQPNTAVVLLFKAKGEPLLRDSLRKVCSFKY